MAQETSFDQICTILREQNGITDELTLETSFQEIGLDSLSIVEAVMACETAFEVEIDPEANPATIGEFVELVDELVEQKG